MGQFDDIGRINKRTYLATTTVLFVAVLISLCARLWIRLVVQKQFGVDDGLITFGVMLLVAAMGMLYYFVDEMYTAEAFLLHAHIGFSYDLIQESFDYQKWASVSLITTWVCINSVKLSFLALFRKLVDRIRTMVIYWWVVLVYTIIVGLYGVSTYVVPCPHFYSFESITCSTGAFIQYTLKWSISQMVLDIVGDILILIIPITLIWRIQVKWTQKIALGFSLCLSVAMIAVTLVRASGLVNGAGIDAAWESFWQYLSAEIGLLLSTATAFRAFFISRGSGGDRRQGRAQKPTWYTVAFQRIRAYISSHRFTSGRSSGRQPLFPGRNGDAETGSNSGGSSSGGSSNNEKPLPELPQIPRPLLTGLRTFIGRKGRTNIDHSNIMASAGRTNVMSSQIMVSQAVDVDVEDGFLQPQYVPRAFVPERGEV